MRLTHIITESDGYDLMGALYHTAPHERKEMQRSFEILATADGYGRNAMDEINPVIFCLVRTHSDAQSHYPVRGEGMYAIFAFETTEGIGNRSVPHDRVIWGTPPIWGVDENLMRARFEKYTKEHQNPGWPSRVMGAYEVERVR